MSDYVGIESCREITDDHIREALETREATKALLDRAIEVAKPRAAGSRVLLIFAKMASAECDWLEGALRVELIAHGDITTIDAIVDIGAGLKERVFPKMKIEVPLDEFLAAIKKFPQAIAPLTAEATTRDRLRLVAGEAPKRTESEPPKKAPRVRTLGYADMPTVGAKRPTDSEGGSAAVLPARRPSVHPPKGTLHRPPTVASASAQQPAKRVLTKLALRKSPLTTTGGGVADEVSAAKEHVDASTRNPKLIRKPPPFVAPQPVEEPSKSDVDKGWGDDE